MVECSVARRVESKVYPLVDYWVSLKADERVVTMVESRD